MYYQCGDWIESATNSAERNIILVLMEGGNEIIPITDFQRIMERKRKRS